MANPSLVIYPNEKIHFKGPYTAATSVTLNLRNPHSDYSFAFKVKTIDPTRYLVKPSKGIVHPHESRQVILELIPLEDDDAAKAYVKSKQKFEVQSVRTEANTNESVSRIFQEASRDEIMATKLLVEFDEPGALSTPRKLASKVKSKVKSLIGRAERDKGAEPTPAPVTPIGGSPKKESLKVISTNSGGTQITFSTSDAPRSTESTQSNESIPSAGNRKLYAVAAIVSLAVLAAGVALKMGVMSSDENRK